MAETYGVAELTDLIAATLDAALPGEVWVRGQIHDLNRSPSGHVYFRIVDADAGPERSQAASLPVVLFASNRRAVNRMLTRAGGGVRMTDGTEVRIRGPVEFFAAQSRVQLRMTGIDPEFTLGRMAIERERLIQGLAADGLLDRNGLLAVPVAPRRVGLVTSADSAAANDVLDELRRSGLGWSVTLVDVRVQGSGAGAELATSLEEATAAGVEIVLLVRGGGARSDLAAFDDETLARTIASSPVPVWTGIGHETDDTVADRVAGTAHKTPTACAAALVARTRGFLDGVEHRGHRIAVHAHRTADRARHRLGAGSRQMRAAAGRVTGERRIHLDAGADRAGAGSRRRIEVEATRLAGADARLATLDPAAMFARGWSIATTGDGRPVTSVDGLRIGARLVTRLADGTVDSDVVDVAGSGGDDHDQ
jgi:exodeoxyribonuclease VII large subunit